MLRVSAVAVALMVSALVGVGCGSDSGSGDSGSTSASTSGGSAQAVKVDVGTSQNVTVPSKGMRIGLFMNSITNAYQKQIVAGATAEAKSSGDSITVYDGGFDPSKQLNQIQNAIQKKDMDAAMVLPIDGQLMCNTTTKLLPDAGIPTVILAQPICGHLTDDGPTSWVPGTVSYVGGNNTRPAIEALLGSAAKTLPGKQSVMLVAGPALGGQSKTLAAVIPEFKKSNPDFDIKYVVNTDYTTPDALTKTQAALKAHPDVTAIVSVYSPDMTRGVVQALTEAGKNGKIPVADAGGAQYSFEQIKKGNLAMTISFFPFSQGKRGVQALNLAASGKTPERFIDESTFGTQAEPIIITKDNVDKYKATY